MGDEDRPLRSLEFIGSSRKDLVAEVMAEANAAGTA